MDTGNLLEGAGVAYESDSDDDVMKFGEDDELYSSGADEDDARWIRKQVITWHDKYVSDRLVHIAADHLSLPSI